MTHAMAKVLTDLAPPPGVVDFMEAEIEKREKAGKTVSSKTKLWLQTWERLWAGMPVPEVDVLTDKEWTEIGEMVPHE